MYHLFRSNDQDSDLDSKAEGSDNSKSYMNGFLPADGAFASCTACGKVLETDEEIVMHSQLCKAINEKSGNNLPTRSTRDAMPPRFPCDVCEKKFKRKEHLIQHRKLHTGKYFKQIYFNFSSVFMKYGFCIG